MPGSAWSSAGVAATITESPTAVTDLPDTAVSAVGADGVLVGVGEACSSESADGLGVRMGFACVPSAAAPAEPRRA